MKIISSRIKIGGVEIDKKNIHSFKLGKEERPILKNSTANAALGILGSFLGETEEPFRDCTYLLVKTNEKTYKFFEGEDLSNAREKWEELCNIMPDKDNTPRVSFGTARPDDDE